MRKETVDWLEAEGVRAAANVRASLSKAVAKTPELDRDVYGKWEETYQIVVRAFSKVMES